MNRPAMTYTANNILTMKYYALSHIQHDGKEYNAGDTIELEKDDVLVREGIVTLEKPVEPKKNKKKKEEAPVASSDNTDEDDETNDDDDGEESKSDYAGMSADQLKDELVKRGLPKGKNNPERIATLEADDEKAEEEEEEGAGVGDDL